MTIDAWITLATLGLILVALVMDRYAPEIVLACGLCILILGGVLTPNLALSGFSNPALITLVALYVLTGSLRETGALDRPSARLLAGSRQLGSARKTYSDHGPTERFFEQYPHCCGNHAHSISMGSSARCFSERPVNAN